MAGKRDFSSSKFCESDECFHLLKHVWYEHCAYGSAIFLYLKEDGFRNSKNSLIGDLARFVMLYGQHRYMLTQCLTVDNSQNSKI